MMIENCPRCGQVKTTFDILGSTMIDFGNDRWEAFSRCRQCWRPSIAKIHNRSNSKPPTEYEGSFIHPDYKFEEWVFVIPRVRKCPEHTPDEIERIFGEAATCEAVGLWDAAGAMFRKVLDAATRLKTPTPIEGDSSTPPWKVYKDLRLRLDWLFERNLLDNSLRELSSCIHQDGNDAAHDLQGIGEAEATDLGEFAEIALRTIFTIPGQIQENQRRRDERRARVE
jgi:hypothetical protein